MKRMILMCAFLIFCFVGCGKTDMSPGTSKGSATNSEGSLGTFRGSMNDLVPVEVGGFKRGKSQTLSEEDIKKDKDSAETGATSGAIGKYVSSDKELGFLAMNFDSPQSAKTGMSKFIDGFKRKIGEDSFTTQEQGEKKKGGTVVGDRIVLHGKNEFAAAEVVVWTNGSVMFMVSTRKSNDDSPLEFERQFPY